MKYGLHPPLHQQTAVESFAEWATNRELRRLQGSARDTIGAVGQDGRDEMNVDETDEPDHTMASDDDQDASNSIPPPSFMPPASDELLSNERGGTGERDHDRNIGGTWQDPGAPTPPEDDFQYDTGALNSDRTDELQLSDHDPLIDSDTDDDDTPEPPPPPPALDDAPLPPSEDIQQPQPPSGSPGSSEEEVDTRDGSLGSQDTYDETNFPDSVIENIKVTQGFIRSIERATLENGKTPEHVIHRLRNPEKPTPVTDRLDILGIELHFALSNSPEAVYDKVRAALKRYDPTIDLPTLYCMRNRVEEVTGIVSVQDDMCVDGCVAFVDEWEKLDHCPNPTCGKPRYDPDVLARTGKKVPRKQMTSVLVGPQIQAIRQSVQGSRAMEYRYRKTREVLQHLSSVSSPDEIVYDDIFCGSEFLELNDRLKLTKHDTLLSFSMDGAQLYTYKKSDTWVGIFLILDYAPNERYKRKRILPAFVIPGPSKPKCLDSCVYRSFHHLSAIQREGEGKGLKFWHPETNQIELSRIIFFCATADALALVELDGRAGHHAARGCRLGCPMKGRHKEGCGHYYAAHLRPNGYTVPECDHPDVDLHSLQTLSTDTYKEDLERLISVPNQSQFEQVRKETGICKPSIISGLHQPYTVPVPRCFTVDLMHHFLLNLPDLFIPLWRGKLKCDPNDDPKTWPWATLKGDLWEQHGKRVEEATRRYPSHFHRPPRNPALSINSGYKATEHEGHSYQLAPGFFRVTLPDPYYRHYCKLIRVVRILTQRKITGAQLKDAQKYAIEFVEEYENLYYQRRPERLQMCRPAIHTLLHVAQEVPRMGPGTYLTQYLMESGIGLFTKQIRQPSNPYSNLARITVRFAQINALKPMYPEFFDTPQAFPRHSHSLGDGYVLLKPRSKARCTVKVEERIAELLQRELGQTTIRKWGRLRLPNGCVARSVFSEERLQRRNPRITCNVKFRDGDGYRFGRVEYYLTCSGDVRDENGEDIIVSRALVRMYGEPFNYLSEESSGMLHAFHFLDEFRLIDPFSIDSVISIQALPLKAGDPDGLWFTAEKSGLYDIQLLGLFESFDEERQADGQFEEL